MDFGERTENGLLVKSAGIVWREIFNQITEEPSFRFRFTRKPRKLEEFVAGAYSVSDWDEVTLTPPSGDGGFDVIARRAAKNGCCSIRILEDTKAYSVGRLVRHETVRAMGFLASRDPAASKCLITTTTDFQPGVYTDHLLSPMIPDRLELRNGDEFLKWLREIKVAHSRNLHRLKGTKTKRPAANQ